MRPSICAKVSEAFHAPSFDIVYDTTSTPEGFAAAIRLAKREVHLKSTNGRKYSESRK